MAEKIGIRELKNQTSSIVRRVREESAEYVITHHGTPIAILKPLDEDDLTEVERQKSLEILDKILAIGAELSEKGHDGMTAGEHLEAMREEENEWPLPTQA